MTEARIARELEGHPAMATLKAMSVRPRFEITHRDKKAVKMEAKYLKMKITDSNFLCRGTEQYDVTMVGIQHQSTLQLPFFFGLRVEPLHVVPRKRRRLLSHRRSLDDDSHQR